MTNPPDLPGNCPGFSTESNKVSWETPQSQANGEDWVTLQSSPKKLREPVFVDSLRSPLDNSHFTHSNPEKKLALPLLGGDTSKENLSKAKYSCAQLTVSAEYLLWSSHHTEGWRCCDEQGSLGPCPQSIHPNSRDQHQTVT